MMKFIKRITKYFLLFVEAVISAPIWSASHALPEGDGFSDKYKKRKAILSLFFRPTFMIFGFFISMLLMMSLGKLASLAISIL